jgi:hypothetical protein
MLLRTELTERIGPLRTPFDFAIGDAGLALRSSLCLIDHSLYRKNPSKTPLTRERSLDDQLYGLMNSVIADSAFQTLVSKRGAPSVT